MKDKPLVSPSVIKASNLYFQKLDAIIQGDPHLKKIFEDAKKYAEEALKKHKENGEASPQAQD